MSLTRALLLDLDNTLIDRDAALLTWLQSFRPRSGWDIDELVALDAGGRGSRRALFERLGIALRVSTAQARAQFERELPQHVRLRSGAIELLSGFRGPKIVITNGSSRVQRAKIAAVGLLPLLDGVVVSQEFGNPKPHASIFQHALALAGVDVRDAATAVMIGDDPAADIAGARSVGITALLLRTRWFEEPPDIAVLSTLSEVRLG